MAETTSLTKFQSRFLCAIVFIYLATLFSYVLIVRRHTPFDDAYITYRYAKNLANGHGITWNIGESPTEGYTNFGLVIILAPFIKLGADPFVVSRILNILAVILTGLLLFYAGRDFYQMDEMSAFLASVIMLHPLSAYVTTLGMETCLYMLGLVSVLVSYNYYLTRNVDRYLIFFGLSSLATFWLRPEGAILVIICLVHLVLVRKPFEFKKFLIPLATTLFIPLLLYFVWKVLYFGAWLPNPFYVKVSKSFFKLSGFYSVNAYFILMGAFILFVPVSYWISDRIRTIMSLATVFVVLNVLFFLQVDTLMDTFNRFLFPLTPMLIILAFPAFKLFFSHLQGWTGNLFYKAALLLILFTLIVGQGGRRKMFFAFSLSYDRMINNTAPRNLTELDGLFIKEKIIAQKLAQFPRIKELTFAMMDVGVIPYITEARVIDLVGLNDSFIARERNVERLMDYVFSQQADLVWLPGDKFKMNWYYGTPGPLGDYRVVTRDGRWRDFAYAGSVDIYRYHYHLFVRKDSKFARELQMFLNEKVIDYYLEPFPLPIG